MVTDGHAVDYAQLQKISGPDPKEDQRRYSPAQCLGAEKRLWSMNDLVALVDAHDAAKPREKPGRKPRQA